MAATGATPISLYYSSTTTNVPTAGNLVAGELALNTADGKLFYKDSSNVVQVIGTKGGVGTSSTTQVLYNSSGLVVGSANLTFNGTTLNTANDASISGLTVGKGVGSISTNTVVGSGALAGSNTGANNAAFGSNVLGVNTSGAVNAGFGINSLAANTTGSNNAGFGVASLSGNTTGNYNTACGQAALQTNTTFSFNTAVGYQALYANAVSGNTATGYQSMLATTTGTSNAAFGLWTLKANTTGQFNTAIGDQALSANTTASYNTAVGYQAGINITTGGGNICLGIASNPSSATSSNEFVFAVGANVTGKGASTGFINPNSGGVYQGNNSTLWSITSDQRLKKNIVDNTDGLNKITAIQVRNFEYRTKDEVTELEPQNAIDIKGVQLGTIAQELQAILPDCVKTESTGVMSVDASNLTWYLINAVKELNATVVSLQAQVTALTKA